MPATAKAKRIAVAKVFGRKHPIDSAHLDFLHRRRHLATVKDRQWREPKYIVEFDELQQHVWKALDRIKERDGARIAREVADRLADSVTVAMKA
jgi:hypothetical protein